MEVKKFPCCLGIKFHEEFFSIPLEGLLATKRPHMEAHAFICFRPCILHMVIDYHSKNMPLKFGDDWLYKLRGIANPSLLRVKFFLMS